MPSWTRLALIVAGGLLGIFASLSLLPKASAGAAPDGNSASGVLAGHAVEHVNSSSVTTPPTIPTTTTVPAPSQPPAAAPTPAPSPAPTSTTVPAPHPSPAPAPPPTVTHGILPPHNPAANIPPQPNFLPSCSGTQYDDSSGCVNTTLEAIANARQAEGLGPMVLPGNWYSLTPQEQLFVSTNLERTARGLPALSAMVSPLDASSAAAAAANDDPEPPGGFGFTQWGSNWAGAVGNPLEAIYFWMYDDGPGSSNV
ncbi:MAG: hypothetical protein ACREC5_08320, partial [Thermoplasmata archaeon]